MGQLWNLGFRLLQAGVIIGVAAGFIGSCSKSGSAGQTTTKNGTVPSSTFSSPHAGADSVLKIRPGEQRHIIVYYFHGNARCPTCFKLEKIAKSEIETDFGDAIKAGTLEWKTVNVEDKGSEHFNDDYKLYTKSVIISIQQDGKEASWKNLEKIWQLVHEEPAYRAYIKNEVKACLEGTCL